MHIINNQPVRPILLTIYLRRYTTKDSRKFHHQDGQALPERGAFFRLQVSELVGISLVEVYEKVRKSAISVCMSV